MKNSFEQTWKDWIKTNIDSGRDPDGIFKILLDEGYSYAAIVKEMNYQPSKPASQLSNPFHASIQSGIKQSESTYTKSHQNNYGKPIEKGALFIPNAKPLDNDDLELYTLDNFLSEDECAKLVALIKTKLKPSGLSSHEADTSYRTSRTCDLARLNDRFIKDIDDRICRLMGIDESYSETIQGQYYDIGQQFKAHTDYFEPHEFETHGAGMGQRTYTVMIYLNDVHKGGETCFLRADKEYKPTTGTAVIWSSLNPDGTTNINSMHQAKPVEEGYKAVITKWFRSNSSAKPAPVMFTKDANEYVPNYTKSGIHTDRLDEGLFKKIVSFYSENRQNSKDEHVPGDFIFTEKAKIKNKKGKSNNTKSTDREPLGSSLISLSAELRQDIHDQMKPLMEEWCEKTLEPTYVYGIREYHNGAILKSHRDRLETHIISAIINVDQDTQEDWPLIIEDNYYRTHHVVLKPGDMVFYEGARLIHGRPLAFKGKSFANIFCHFKPTDYVPKQLT